MRGTIFFGDGVNVAARLEALAEPGGVFVSNTVHDHVRDRLPFVFEDLGEQQFKNVARRMPEMTRPFACATVRLGSRGPSPARG